MAAAIDPAVELVEQVVHQLLTEENSPWTPTTQATHNEAAPSSLTESDRGGGMSGWGIFGITMGVLVAAAVAVQHARSDPLHPHPQHVSLERGARMRAGMMPEPIEKHREGALSGAGCGFRPTVWRLAQDCGIAGEVWNDAQGVMIQAWGMPAALDEFIHRLRDNPPPLARIDTVECTPLSEVRSLTQFDIIASRTGVLRPGSS